MAVLLTRIQSCLYLYEQLDPTSVQLGGVDREAEEKRGRKRLREEQEEKRRRREKQRLEEEERGRKRAKRWVESSVGGELGDREEEEEEEEEEKHQEDEGQEGHSQKDPSFKPHVRTRPTHIQLSLPINEFREEASNITNRRKLSDRGQSDLLSTMVLQGGGDLSDFPCSTSTMRK